MTTIITLSKDVKELQNNIGNWAELGTDLQQAILAKDDYTFYSGVELLIYGGQDGTYSASFGEVGDVVYIENMYSNAGKLFETDYTHYEF